MSAEEIQLILKLLGIESVSLAHAAILCLCLFILLPFFCHFIKSWIKSARWRTRYISEILRDYGEYHTKQANRLYIETYCQNIPPSDYIDPIESHNVSVKESLMVFYLDKVLVNPNPTSRLYCILAGSGMGKSTFVCQLIRRYVRKYKREDRLPYHIELFCLGSNDVLEKISMVQDKHNKVLILDGLDENVDALDDYNTFRAKLETLIQDFRIVIITCRTQFFDDESSEIKESRLINTGLSKGFRTYNKHYISPFTPEQVSEYIRKLYPFHRKKRRRCNQILQQCSGLFVRPLMIGYLKDLISTKSNYSSISDIYELLIREWINRDVANINADNDRGYASELYDFSQKFAVYIYNNRLENNGLFLKKEDFSQFLETHNFTASPSIYRIKSLINRDSTGKLKFAHKSFLEYFLAREAFNNPDFKCQLEGLDMFNKFYHEFCLKEYLKYEQDGIVDLREFDTYKSGTIKVLLINRRSDYNYSHLPYIPNVLVLNWDSFNDSLNNWMLTEGCENILIHKFKAQYSLNSLLAVPRLKQIMVINSIPPSNTFTKAINKKNIKLIYKNEIALDDAIRDFCIVPAFLREQAEIFPRFFFEI